MQNVVTSRPTSLESTSLFVLLRFYRALFKFLPKNAQKPLQEWGHKRICMKWRLVTHTVFLARFQIYR